jgi:hypothetical protein
MNSRNLLFTALEAGKSKIKVLTDLVSGEDHLPGLQSAIFFCLHRLESKEVISFISVLIRALISFMGLHCHDNLLPPPSTTTLGIKFQQMNFEGTHSAHSNFSKRHSVKNV